MDPAKAVKQVLLVDDNALFLGALRGFVAGFPQLHVVATAATGEQAVALAERLSPELIVMDIDMPGVGGLEAARIIKTLPRAPQVLIVTLHEREDYRDAALAAGADFFVVKDRLHDEFPGIVARIMLETP